MQIKLSPPVALLLAADLLCMLCLFFAAGVTGEGQFISEEVKILVGHEGRWDLQILSLVLLSALRVTVLLLLWSRAAAAAAAATPPAAFCALFCAASTALSAVRLRWLVETMPFGSPKFPGGSAAQAAIAASVAFSATELLTGAALWAGWRREARAGAVRSAAVGINDGDGAAVEDGEKGGAGDQPGAKASLKRLAGLAVPERGLLLIGSCALLITSAAGTATPLFFGIVIDKVVNATAGHAGQRALDATLLDLFGIFVVQAAASFVRAYTFTLAGQKLVARVRRELFAVITQQEIAFFDTTRTGELINRLSSDTGVIQNACTVNISMMLRNTVSIIFSLGLMFTLSPSLTGVLLAVVPLVGIGAVFYGKKVKGMSVVARRAAARAARRLNPVAGKRPSKTGLPTQRRRRRSRLDRFGRCERLRTRRSANGSTMPRSI